MFSLSRTKNSLTYKLFSLFVSLAFFSSMCVLPPSVSAQSLLNLPAPGAMVTPSMSYFPATMAGMTIHPENPLMFDFIITTGDDDLKGEEFRKESQKLINYFLATLTVPDDEMWVNLSPYEKDRIIADGLGETEMGRDMLVQDYMLKQLTASMMYPEEELGDEFWKKIYAKAQAKFGTTEIPTDTFNKVWIVPEEAVVYVNGTNVFVSESHLKVMLEEDYLSLEANQNTTNHGVGEVTKDSIEVMSDEAKELIREMILPEIEREVNEGKNFANLRQIYHSMILATWYKKNLKESALGKVYMDQNKTNGIDLEDKQIKEKIYAQYVEAFEKGVYNYIREDHDPVTQEMIPRKYFSGGLQRARVSEGGSLSANSPIARAERGLDTAIRVRERFDLANARGAAIDIGQRAASPAGFPVAKRAQITPAVSSPISGFRQLGLAVALVLTVCSGAACGRSSEDLSDPDGAAPQATSQPGEIESPDESASVGSSDGSLDPREEFRALYEGLVDLIREAVDIGNEANGDLEKYRTAVAAYNSATSQLDKAEGLFKANKGVLEAGWVAGEYEKLEEELSNRRREIKDNAAYIKGIILEIESGTIMVNAPQEQLGTFDTLQKQWLEIANNSDPDFEQSTAGLVGIDGEVASLLEGVSDPNFRTMLENLRSKIKNTSRLISFNHLVGQYNELPNNASSIEGLENVMWEAEALVREFTDPDLKKQAGDLQRDTAKRVERLGGASSPLSNQVRIATTSVTVRDVLVEFHKDDGRSLGIIIGNLAHYETSSILALIGAVIHVDDSNKESLGQREVFGVKWINPTREELEDADRRLKPLLAEIIRLKEAYGFTDEEVLHAKEEAINTGGDIKLVLRSDSIRDVLVEFHKDDGRSLGIIIGNLAYYETSSILALIGAVIHVDDNNKELLGQREVVGVKWINPTREELEDADRRLKPLLAEIIRLKEAYGFTDEEVLHAKEEAINTGGDIKLVLRSAKQILNEILGEVREDSDAVLGRSLAGIIYFLLSDYEIDISTLIDPEPKTREELEPLINQRIWERNAATFFLKTHRKVAASPLSAQPLQDLLIRTATREIRDIMSTMRYNQHPVSRYANDPFGRGQKAEVVLADRIAEDKQSFLEETRPKLDAALSDMWTVGLLSQPQKEELLDGLMELVGFTASMRGEEGQEYYHVESAVDRQKIRGKIAETFSKGVTVEAGLIPSELQTPLVRTATREIRGLMSTMQYNQYPVSRYVNDPFEKGQKVEVVLADKIAEDKQSFLEETRPKLDAALSDMWTVGLLSQPQKEELLDGLMELVGFTASMRGEEGQEYYHVESAVDRQKIRSVIVAAFSAPLPAPGGIDFNPNNLNLQEQGQAINFTLNNSILQNLQPNSVQGILPVIINITPITNFVPLLGKAIETEEQQLSQI